MEHFSVFKTTASLCSWEATKSCCCPQQLHFSLLIRADAELLPEHLLRTYSLTHATAAKPSTANLLPVPGREEQQELCWLLWHAIPTQLTAFSLIPRKFQISSACTCIMSTRVFQPPNPLCLDGNYRPNSSQKKPKSHGTCLQNQKYFVFCSFCFADGEFAWWCSTLRVSISRNSPTAHGFCLLLHVEDILKFFNQG